MFDVKLFHSKTFHKISSSISMLKVHKFYLGNELKEARECMEILMWVFNRAIWSQILILQP